MQKRVLIVDDSVLTRRMMYHFLADTEWEVVGEACNGCEAVFLYQELKPDVVTMDIVLPVYDGLAAMREILEFDPNARIIVVSALSQTKLISEAIRDGARDFLRKPFSPEELVETLDKCLNTGKVTT